MSITLKNVSLTWQDGTAQAINALLNVSLHIEDGEFVGIMGQTGCGKSSLIQAIAGLLPISEGQILIQDNDIHSKSYDKNLLRQTIGFIFQYPETQLFETTVEKDVAFGLKYSGLSKAEVTQRVRQALTFMGFIYEDIKRESPLALSGGEKRRIAIAGVLACKPRILILDEPIAGLDPRGRESFLKLLHKLNKEGTTIIMVSHNADALSEYAHRILVMENGRILLDDTPGRIFHDIPFMEQHHLDTSNPCRITWLLRQQGIHLSKEAVSYDSFLHSLVSHCTAIGNEYPIENRKAVTADEIPPDR